MSIYYWIAHAPALLHNFIGSNFEIKNVVWSWLDGQHMNLVSISDDGGSIVAKFQKKQRYLKRE